MTNARESLPEGTVTVLFTDVAGSTDLTNRLGDEAGRAVLRAVEELMREQVARHRGHEVKGLGDGLMVAFTSARRAVACAVDIQRALARRNRQQPDRAVRVRIGLNTGEVIREQEDLFGATVNAAARIAAHAGAGQILVSEAVKGVLGSAGNVRLEDRGEWALKGFTEPWRLYEAPWDEETGPAALALFERTPYVGREDERAALRELVEQTARGHGALVLIGGEPGVGKTRLTEEVTAEARGRGLLTLTGHCVDMQGAQPYLPFVEILEAATRIVPPEALRAALGDAAPEAAKLMPELRRLFPDIPPPIALPPEQERRYLLNSLREFLARLAGVGATHASPLLLVLDDLHWADEGSLLMLGHIAQRLAELPVLVLGAYRDVELTTAHPLGRTLQDLLRARLAHDIRLRRLPEEGVAAMLRARAAADPPSHLVKLIYSETEGNPFFVEEVFRHLSEEGKLFDAEGSWRADLAIGEAEVPRGVRLVIGQRLARVGEACRRALTAAAVVGRTFDYDLLAAMGDLDADALLDAVEEAEGASLIHDVPTDRQARYAFTHELIRQTLLSTLSLPRRQRLHLRVAEAMERVYARDLDERAAELAHHLEQAGAAADPAKTVRFLALAGEQALTAAAFEDAVRLFSRALNLLRTNDAHTRADLCVRRGQALRSLGRGDEAVADWHEALALYDETGDAAAFARVSAELARQYAYAGRFDEATTVIRAGMERLGDAITAERCLLLGEAGYGAGITGECEQSFVYITQALAIAEQLGDPRLTGRTLANKAFFHWSAAQPREEAEAAREAAQLARADHEYWHLADALTSMAYPLIRTGRVQEAAVFSEELDDLATRLGHWFALRIVRYVEALVALMREGDIAPFEAASRSDIELLAAYGLPWGYFGRINLGLISLWRGLTDEATAHFDDAVANEPPRHGFTGSWAFAMLGRAYAGDRAGAMALFSERHDELPKRGRLSTYGARMVLAAAVEALAVLDERETAAALFPLVVEALDTGDLIAMPWGHRLLSTVAGMAATAGRAWPDAEAYYRLAISQASELPHRIEQPEVRRWYARMLLDRDAPGDREQAHRLLTEAVAMYGTLGMPRHVDMADALLDKA